MAKDATPPSDETDPATDAGPSTGSGNGGSVTETGSDRSTGSGNRGSGPEAGSDPSTGSGNRGSGPEAGNGPSTGSGNDGSRPEAGSDPSTGSGNGGSGPEAGSGPSTGSGDDGSGPEADSDPSTGSGNTGSGSGGAGSGGAGSGGPWAAYARPAAAGSGNGARFYGWLRSLGLPRQPGWIGGVSAGIAARLGIDPLIVRGVLIVFALFGAPAFILYGIAWLLLPDTSGRIHLEELLRGVFDSAIVGIAIFLLVGLFPGNWGGRTFFSSAFDSVTSGGFLPHAPWVGGIISGLWTITLIGGAVALVIWLVHRSRETPTAGYGSTSPQDAFAQYEAEAATGTAATAAAGGTTPTASAAAGTDTLTAGTLTGPTTPLPPTPPTPPSGAPRGSDDYAAWKLQHETWRAENDAWRRSQAEASRAARAQLAAENKARAAQFQAQAEQARRLRRQTRPRISFAYFIAALGCALLAGAIAAIAALSSAGTSAYATSIGLSAATIATALAMVGAGIARRRSGWLAFFTVALLLFSLVSATAPRSQIVGAEFSTDVVTRSVVQPAGTIDVQADAALLRASGTPHLAITQGGGEVVVRVDADVALRFDVRCGNCSIRVESVSGDLVRRTQVVQLAADRGRTSWNDTVGPDGRPADARVSLRGGASTITIQSIEENR
ncbi:PspC domain-containing protein [Rathayibacter sp. YIM 133350]|uniref:PspC domain-containing protein n=1 Tax=Rathayibacter sp. YIM 133350 TaxID=3131992 RepID=UPI00307F9F97